jgi:hypothetical protein
VALSWVPSSAGNELHRSCLSRLLPVMVSPFYMRVIPMRSIAQRVKLFAIVIDYRRSTLAPELRTYLGTILASIPEPRKGSMESPQRACAEVRGNVFLVSGNGCFPHSHGPAIRPRSTEEPTGARH